MDENEVAPQGVGDGERILLAPRKVVSLAPGKVLKLGGVLKDAVQVPVLLPLS